MSFSEYTNKSVDEVLKIFKTSKNGLSKKDSLLSQQKYGLNEIKIKNVKVLDILFRQFKSPFFYLLLIAAIVSIAIGELIDSVTILVFIILNLSISFFQEYRAERAVFLLQKYIPHKVKILRNSKEEFLDSKLLVPGDIVLLEQGSLVPADLRLVSVHNFLVDESVLTGESVPVLKFSEAFHKEESEIFKAKNIDFSGTTVASGKATAVVIATGKNTVFGGLEKTISGITRESAYEKSILYFSKLILKIVVVTISLVFISNILLKGVDDIFSLILFADSRAKILAILRALAKFLIGITTLVA